METNSDVTGVYLAPSESASKSWRAPSGMVRNVLVFICGSLVLSGRRVPLFFVGHHQMASLADFMDRSVTSLADFFFKYRPEG